MALAVGQRLVTLGGALRRWDGYVATSDGAAAAERLERMTRLRVIAAARPATARVVAAAEQELARIDAGITAARVAAADARRALDRADTAARAATRAEDRATGAIERLDAQRSDLAARGRRGAQEHDVARSELAAAAATSAAMPDGRATRERVAALHTAAERARMLAATARADRAGLERDLVQTRQRLVAGAAEADGWRARAGEAARRIVALDLRDADLVREAEALHDRPATLAAEVAALDTAHVAARAAADTAADAERAADAALRATDAPATAAAEALSAAREARAGVLARAENQVSRCVEMNRLAGERFQCPAVLLPERVGFDAASVGAAGDVSAEHDRLLVERERIGPVNLVAERELAELDAAARANAAERDDLALAVNRLRGSIGTLNRAGRQRLLAAFEAVDGHFRRLFTTLFEGGAAHLALVDSDDPLEAGLEIMAQPPGKTLQSLTLLSGGEQALTAVALIFGLFLTNPAPICVLDEVDAPLDDANIERFCDLLDAMTRETATRYLIVTHNAVTMSRMHRLFGVTMVERGVSRLVSVDLGGAETLLAAG